MEAGMTRSARPRVLVVDDRSEMAEMVADGLCDHGFDAKAMASARRAAARLAVEPFEALVTDLRMAEVDGFELLAVSQQLAPERPVIVMTAYGAIDSAIESIRRGAAHYLTKPFKSEELVIFLRRALEQVELRREARELKQALRQQRARSALVASSKPMRDVLDLVARVADADASVLVLGETGTGKGLVAELLHRESARSGKPFVTVNCAALPEPLLESELFGHVKGAFTGASANRAGLFVEAEGGTLFLDEIGDMAAPLQAKLLHVLERRVVRPLGGAHEREVDVRIVAATHRNLPARVREGTFREDLLYRLDVVSFVLPPLRQRSEDLPELIEHFFQNAKVKHPGSSACRIAPEAMQRLLDHRWPGNVRELAHVLERTVLLTRTVEIGVSDLPESVRALPAEGSGAFGGEVRPMRELQRAYASWAYEQLGGHRARAAEALGVDPKTLSRLLDQGPLGKAACDEDAEK
jgi:two-component system response regulator HydG